MVVSKIIRLVFDSFFMLNSLWFIDRGDPLPSSEISRNNFPKNFTFGSASAAYQFEGGYNEDGRGPSIWDAYTHNHPERIADGSNGDVAVDHYHRYKEDVALMKDVGLDAYRFSISWTRILPNGKLSGGVNKKGIQFYNNLIDELISKGMQPYVTLFHWDVPQNLEDEYGGFLSSRIVQDFQDYVEVCYKEFGDRVKHWITLNEPRSLSNNGYNRGTQAPGRCSQTVGNCSAGNSGTEPYITAHNQLLAHGAAVKIYKDKFQALQQGKIGITLVCDSYVPYTESRADKDAAQRATDFMYGWFMHPITYGRYPSSMRTLCGNRLPRFTKEESQLLKGSYDFLGLNYYTANYAISKTVADDDVQPSYYSDARATLATEKNGVPIGLMAGSDWLFVYPAGIREVLLYTKQRYKNPTIYITENGVDEVNDSTLSLEEALSDDLRIDYHRRHLSFVLRAIEEGVDVRGYFVWSFMDNFEWAEGYTVRFGMTYVDYKTMKRYPKHSSIWFKKFLLRSESVEELSSS
ncbi:beta-glucosidase [Ranunculus cassubicifolius]